jgi:anaerobic selenocysteine-containing dehydrogenase
MKENNVSRRDFVKTLGVVGVGSMVGAGQALAQSNAPAASTPVKPVKIPTRPFGRTKVPVAILGPGGDFDIEANQIILKRRWTGA